MSDGVLLFEVLGHPEPAGSKTAFRNPHTGIVNVVDANRKAKPWQAVVAAAGQQAMSGRVQLTGPLHVEMTFMVRRPKGHYGSGRNSSQIKPSAPAYPIVKPDVLKLARGVEDALTGVVWRDDALIVREGLSKVYAEPEGVLIGVRQLVRFEPALADLGLEVRAA